MADWFRSWHGAPTDTKWLTISRRASVLPGIVAAVAWALMDHASQAEDRGDVSGFDVETYAAFSGFDEDEVSAVVRAMTEKGMISGGRLVNWEKRQPVREDGSSERAKAWRERRKAEANDTTEARARPNASERIRTHGNASETEADTESDPEQQQPRGRAHDVDALGGRLLAAAGWRPDEIHDGMRALAPILRLMDAGCDLERDILPTVQRLAARGARPKSWSYFDDAIIEARDTRLRPVPEPSQAAPGQGPPRPRSRADDDMERQRAILARIEAAAATEGDAA